jgi:hypothetical protein
METLPTSLSQKEYSNNTNCKPDAVSTILPMKSTITSIDQIHYANFRGTQPRSKQLDVRIILPRLRESSARMTDFGETDQFTSLIELS